MPYNRKNGNNERVIGFKDGQPVYKRVNRGESHRGGEQSGAKRGSGYGRGDRERFRNGSEERRAGKNSDDYRSNRSFDSRFERGSNERGRTGGEYRHSRHEVGERDYNRSTEGFERRPEGFNRRTRHTEERNSSAERAFAREPQAQTFDEAELPNIIMGRNPVKEAIKAGRSIDRILVTNEHDGSLNEILDLAYGANMVVRNVDRSKLDEICLPFGHNGRTGNHQGIIAYVPGVEYCELSDILDYANERGEAPFVILLDGIEDPHNLGSIIRSAECAGAHGVVITKRRSASVTATVVKTSAGATEHMRIAKVVNLAAAIEKLKEAGVWVAAADMGGEPMYSADLKGAFALVVGAEGEGVSRLVKEKCDYIISVPLKGEMESLNASVAAAVIMFEKVRQDAE